MELKIITLFFSVALMTACAYQPTPYKVVRSVDYEKGALAGKHKFGVTEQRISETQYVLSVRLDSGSSPIRAQNMLLLHAANMATNNGYDAFTKKKAKVGKWCNKSHNRATGRISINDGGPTAIASISFVKMNEQKSKKKIKVANDIINNLSSKVNDVITSEEADSNTESILQSCWENRY